METMKTNAEHLIPKKPLVKPGDRYGQRTVLGKPFYLRLQDGHRRQHCVVKCDCGDVSVVSCTRLTSGKCDSCWRCYSDRRTKWHSVELCNAYHGMMRRCYDKSHDAYKHYGAAGVIVCDEWRLDHTAFQSFVLANGWRPGLRLDRIQCDGNYEPDNVRIVTIEDSANNKRCSFRIKIGGQDRTLAQWCRLFGNKREMVSARIKDLGWDEAVAVCLPANTGRKYPSSSDLSSLDQQIESYKRRKAAGFPA